MIKYKGDYYEKSDFFRYTFLFGYALSLNRIFRNKNEKAYGQYFYYGFGCDHQKKPLSSKPFFANARKKSGGSSSGAPGGVYPGFERKTTGCWGLLILPVLVDWMLVACCWLLVASWLNVILSL
ncbi:MAG: hypothetical protein R6U46_12095 [Marinilabilia sp.]